MLFRIDQELQTLEPVKSDWSPRELELEKYLVASVDDDAQMLSEAVFGEPLLLVSNQVRTRVKKRADILALDRAGNGVIVELKRDQGRLGVETQALQYLADFSAFQGRHFLERFSRARNFAEEIVPGFLGDEVRIEDINKRSRVVLVARSFDETVFSIGEWMSSKGVAFRCITYTPAEVANEQLLSFSVAFDRSPETLYQLKFGGVAREPGIFWHNIARPDDAWWSYLVAKGEIPACFENQPGDQGETLLKRYVSGDRVVAYAKGYGAVGWGVVENPASYRLLREGDSGDLLDSNCRHRLSIKWQATAPVLADGVPAEEVRREFGIHHPISTSVSMDDAAGDRLCAHLSRMFKQG